jgi:hypothetical protein
VNRCCEQLLRPNAARSCCCQLSSHNAFVLYSRNKNKVIIDATSDKPEKTINNKDDKNDKPRSRPTGTSVRAQITRPSFEAYNNDTFIYAEDFATEMTCVEHFKVCRLSLDMGVVAVAGCIEWSSVSSLSLDKLRVHA